MESVRAATSESQMPTRVRQIAAQRLATCNTASANALGASCGKL